MCVNQTAAAKYEGYIQSPTNRRGELNCTLTLTDILPGSWLELQITNDSYNLYANCRPREQDQHNFFSISRRNRTACRPRAFIRYQVMSTEAAISFYSTNFKEDHIFLLRYRG